jgi:hypothetical protein
MLQHVYYVQVMLHLLHALFIQVVLLVVVPDGPSAAHALEDVLKDVSDPVVKAAPINQIKQKLANVAVVQGLLLLEVTMNGPHLFLLLLDWIDCLHLIDFDGRRLPHAGLMACPRCFLGKVTTIEFGLVELPKELGGE